MRLRPSAASLTTVLAFVACAAHAGGDPAPAKADAHAATARAPAKAAAKAAPTDNLEQLRDRLVEKLGASKPPEAKAGNVVRVAARAEGPLDAHGTVVATAVAAPRKAAAPAPVPAVVEAHRAAKAEAGHAAHWAYGGETGPAAWGGLKPEFQLCSTGKRQSPIDIRGGIAVDLEPIQFDYRGTGFNVVDNGHTVQVNMGAGNSLQVGGRRYELVQFHFHRPAEERINGRQYDMSLHLVHKDPEGRLAVVGLLLERGAPQPVVQSVWNNLPLEQGLEQASAHVLDLNHLLPADRGYYTYMGSLTTPPCSEGVLWMVMRQPVTVSQSQIDIFARLYPMNARPVQNAAGRLIKQSQ